jgi:hypothetical protein
VKALTSAMVNYDYILSNVIRSTIMHVHMLTQRYTVMLCV